MTSRTIQTFARLGSIGLVMLMSFATAGSARATDVSSNWAGYVAAPSAAGSHYSSVSGSWTEPSVTCTKRHVTYSAVWVGLGGARESASALEQIGTDADCTRSGRAVYSTWFELLPAEAVGTRLGVHPGDRMTGSVTVRRGKATLRLRNLTTGRRFSITRRLAHEDVSSAEWIVEAPSICTNAGSCRAYGLSDFGQVSFTAASATADGHTGPIADPGWSATALELRQGFNQGASRGATAGGAPSSSSVIAASPSSAANAQGAFAVTWQEQAVQDERSKSPTLPGASGSGG
ncbi:MAG: G1 family glutamic endopeptidase [Solirubrobacteraceae bacterium]